MVFCVCFLKEETRKKPKMTIVESAQPGSEPLCTVDLKWENFRVGSNNSNGGARFPTTI